MADFEIRIIERQPTAAIRLNSTMSDIGPAMGSAFGQLFEAIAAAGLEPAGPPLARYLSFGAPTIDYECAVPVSAPIPPSGQVQPSHIGGSEAAVGTHVGPYETISQTWEAMMRWVAEQGRQPAGAFWETYLTDPAEEPDPARYVTEVFIPLL